MSWLGVLGVILCALGCSADFPPEADPNDSISVFWNLAPVTADDLGELLTYFNLHHASVSFRNHRTGKEAFVEYIAPNFGTPILFPDLSDKFSNQCKGGEWKASLTWRNQGYVMYVDSKDAGYNWESQQQVGTITGAVYNRVRVWIMGATLKYNKYYMFQLDAFYTPQSGGTHYYEYQNTNVYTNRGGIELDDANAPSGLSADQCQLHCEKDTLCECVVLELASGRCFKRANCVPDRFASQNGYITWMNAEGGTNYKEYTSYNSYNGHGGQEIDDAHAPSGLTPKKCKQLCSQDILCECVVLESSTGKCFKRENCIPEQFDQMTGYSTWMRDDGQDDFASMTCMQFAYRVLIKIYGVAGSSIFDPNSPGILRDDPIIHSSDKPSLIRTGDEQAQQDFCNFYSNMDKLRAFLDGQVSFPEVLAVVNSLIKSPAVFHHHGEYYRFTPEYPFISYSSGPAPLPGSKLVFKDDECNSRSKGSRWKSLKTLKNSQGLQATSLNSTLV